MSAAQRNARIGHAGHARLQVAILAQEIHRHTMLPAQIQPRRTDRARPKDTDRFEMVDGNGQFPNINGRLPIALLRRQAIGIDRHLDLKREMVARDVRTRSCEIKCVLLNAVHRSQISNLKF